LSFIFIFAPSESFVPNFVIYSKYALWLNNGKLAILSGMKNGVLRKYAT